MRCDLIEIEHDSAGIHGVSIRLGWILRPTLDVLLRESLNPRRLEPLVHASQIGNCDLINREPAHQRPPLGAHVGDGKTGIHRKAGHAGPAELDRGVQYFVVVIQSAERDDDIFPGCSFRQFSFEHNLDGSRNLPPEITGRPNGGSIGAHDRRAYRTESAVHVGV